MRFEFHIKGEPAPQGSKRHVGGGRMVESSKKLPAWRKEIEQQARQQWQRKPPLDEPVMASGVVYVPRPKRPKFGWPAVRPDLDKLARAIGDGLEQAGVLREDSRITWWNIRKEFTNNEATGAHITLETLPSSPVEALTPCPWCGGAERHNKTPKTAPNAANHHTPNENNPKGT